MKKMILLCAILTLATAFIALPPSAAMATDPEFLSIGGGPSGGTFNVVATGLADVLRKTFPDSLIDVQPGGSGPNILRVSAGKVNLGITSASNACDAFNGRDPATPEKPIKNLMGLMVFFPSAIQVWVPADSDINTLQDLKGKQVSAGQPGQTSWLAFMNLLKVHGMSVADIEQDGGKLHKLSWRESQNGLRNGQLDAVMWVSLYPHPSTQQTAISRPLRTLSFGDKEIQEYLKKYGCGFSKVELPAGMYKGMKQPVNTMGSKTFLFASKDMSDEMAYKIVSTIWKNLTRFKKTHALLNFINKDTAGKGMFVPVHPGAKKFYDEQGIVYD